MAEEPRADRFEVIAKEILELRKAHEVTAKEILELRKEMRLEAMAQRNINNGMLLAVQGILEVLQEDTQKARKKKGKKDR